MAYFVFEDAKIKCNLGDMESKLVVTDPEGEGYVNGKSAANVGDHLPLKNIFPFGRCKSPLNPSVAAATASNFGVLQPMPCGRPLCEASPWENETPPGIYIRGLPALVNDAKLMCYWGGIIEVTEPYITGIFGTGAIPVDSLFLEDYFGMNYDRGPGTRYINQKGQVIYQTRDGVGRILIVLDENVSSLEYRLREAKENSRLNHPFNDHILGLGLTGEQYTEKMTRSGTQYKQSYYSGYWGGNYTALERFFYWAKETEKKDMESVQDQEDRSEGLDDGIADRKNGRIDRFKPLARISGGPLLQI